MATGCLWLLDSSLVGVSSLSSDAGGERGGGVSGGAGKRGLLVIGGGGKPPARGESPKNDVFLVTLEGVGGIPSRERLDSGSTLSATMMPSSRSSIARKSASQYGSP